MILKKAVLMMRIIFAKLIILAFFVSSFSQGRYLLRSELLTNFGPSSTAARLTTYSFDNNGHTVQKLAYLGSDTASGLDNSTTYGYDSKQRLIIELLLNSGVDTTSLIYYSYDTNSNLSEIRTMVNKSGNWQIDSLKYDSNQRLVQRWHYAAIIDYHNYSYNASGQEITDTLFESTGAAFVPTQASIFDYSVSNVTTQNDYFVTGGTWYPQQSTVTKYSNNHILSTAVYQPNGAIKALEDSLSYSYDTLGNKTQVSHYDKTGTRTYTIDYQWISNPYAAIFVRAAPAKKNMDIAYSKRYVTLRHTEGAIGDLSIFTLDGKLIRKETVIAGQNYSMALPGIAQGKYIAVYNSSGMRQSLAFNVTN